MLTSNRAIGLAIMTVFFHLLTLHAQAVPAAQQPMQIHLYGLFSGARPDYYDAPNASSTGITAGGHVDVISILPFTELGLEVRGISARSHDINESSLAGGPRISFNRFRVQPYGEYMFGLGRGEFNHVGSSNYRHDNSTIRSYGGGVTLGLTRNFDLQADMQRQRWRFTYQKPYFYPVQVSVGFRYRLHLPSSTGPR